MKKHLIMLCILVFMFTSCAIENEGGHLDDNSELNLGSEGISTDDNNSKINRSKVEYDYKRVEKTFIKYRKEIDNIINGSGTDFRTYGGYGSYSLENCNIDEDFMKYYAVGFEDEMKYLLENSDIVLISLSPDGIEFLFESIEDDTTIATCLEYSFEDDYLERVESNSTAADMIEITKLEPHYYFASVDLKYILPEIDESNVVSKE